MSDRSSSPKLSAHAFRSAVGSFPSHRGRSWDTGTWGSGVRAGGPERLGRDGTYQDEDALHAALEYPSFMVRRDAKVVPAFDEAGVSIARCAFPTGGSPVPVGAEAPGSRPRAGGEIRPVQAGRREPARRRRPCSGEQQRGPQHEVKLAASTEEQSGSRAAHVTAKATSDVLVSERASGPGGVRSAARVEGEVRNTRDPSASPRRGKARRISRRRNRPLRSGSPRGP
jgi:hypothetical protein